MGTRRHLACVLLLLLASWPPGPAAADCPPAHPVVCDGWCCEKSFACGTVTQCCIPPQHGEECPPGSCAYCPVQWSVCVGWSGTNYTCCVESALRCKRGDDVWCCDNWETCGVRVGHCVLGGEP